MADMDHNEAIRLMATEKYLLNELEPELRDAFEEHYFACSECALDVKAATAFRDHCRSMLVETPAPMVLPERKNAAWVRWFRPAVVVPVMAGLFAIIGIQLFVLRPRLQERVAKLETPQILPFVSLINVNTRGVDRNVMRIHAGDPFLVFIDIPPDQSIASYQAELAGPDGVRRWALAITSEMAKDTVAIRVPPGLKTPGAYTLIVRGARSMDNNAMGTEVGRYPFELQVY